MNLITDYEQGYQAGLRKAAEISRNVKKTYKEDLSVISDKLLAVVQEAGDNIATALEAEANKEV